MITLATLMRKHVVHGVDGGGGAGTRDGLRSFQGPITEVNSLDFSQKLCLAVSQSTRSRKLSYNTMQQGLGKLQKPKKEQLEMA